MSYLDEDEMRQHQQLTHPNAPAEADEVTVAELQDKLRSQGKATSGTKDELLARLNEGGDES
jgi:hypothetical protein